MNCAKTIFFFSFFTLSTTVQAASGIFDCLFPQDQRIKLLVNMKFQNAIMTNQQRQILLPLAQISNTSQQGGPLIQFRFFNTPTNQTMIVAFWPTLNRAKFLVQTGPNTASFDFQCRER